VSVRADDERGSYNNKVSAMFAELPVGLEDPVERVHSLHEQMHDLKQSGQAVAAERLTALGGFAPAMLLALGGRVATRLPQSAVNTVTTNVPGPQYPLYLSPSSDSHGWVDWTVSLSLPVIPRRLTSACPPSRL
jgi:hypothetical protein